MSSEPESVEELQGWEFEFKLQDYTQVKTASSLYNEMNKSLLAKPEYFEEIYGRDGMQDLVTPKGSPSKQQAFKAKG